MVKITILTYVTVMLIPVVKMAMPGTFFWRPRTKISISQHYEPYPPLRTGGPDNRPRITLDKIQDGRVVLIEGYNIGITIMAIAAATGNRNTYPHLNPKSANYYTNAYRWALRYFDRLGIFTSGHGHYVDTHKVWNSRYSHMHDLVPNWLRKTLFFIDDKEWANEDDELRRFKMYIEPSIGVGYAYPPKLIKLNASEFTRDSELYSFMHAHSMARAEGQG